MEIMLLEQQHFLKSPLRFFSEMDHDGNGNASSFIAATMINNARLHQMWSSQAGPPTTTSSSADLQAAAAYAANGGVVQFTPPALARLPVPLHLWPSSGAAAAAAAAAASGLPWGSIQQPIGLLRSQPPPPSLISRNSCTSPIPSDLRLPKSTNFPSAASHLQSNRFSPYQNMHKKSTATVIDMHRN